MRLILTNYQVSRLLAFYSAMPRHISAMENALMDLGSHDDIYSIAVSHQISGMPTSNQITNKTARIATLYEENLKRERANMQKCILIYRNIKLKIDIALASLGEEAAFEVEQHYIFKKTVDEVSLEADKLFIPCCIRLRYVHLRKSLEKLGRLIKISKHELAAISHLFN